MPSLPAWREKILEIPQLLSLDAAAGSSSFEPMLLLRVILILAFGLTIATGESSAPAVMNREAPEDASNSPIHAALYFTGWEITKEIVIAPQTLQQMLGLEWQEKATITQEMRESVARDTIDLLADFCQILIDGAPAEFTPDGIQFIEPDEINFLPLSEDQSVPMEDFRVVVKYSTPLPQLDSTVIIIWQDFPEGVSEIPLRIADTLGSRARIITPETGPFMPPFKLASNLRDAPEPPPLPDSSASPHFLLPALSLTLLTLCGWCLWRKKWLVSALLIIAAVALLIFQRRQKADAGQQVSLVSEEDAKVISDRILESVYHAFNFHDDETQYEVLAQVLAEPALTETFLETNRTVETRKREGSQVRVQSVRVDSAEPTLLSDKSGFSAKTKWRTAGQIGHWGHFHDRENLFTAELQIEVKNGKWKATQFKIQNRERQ